MMARELQAMKNSKTGFESATGTVLYFNEQQDSIGSYDLVNLNVSQAMAISSLWLIEMLDCAQWISLDLIHEI